MYAKKTTTTYVKKQNTCAKVSLKLSIQVRFHYLIEITMFFKWQIKRQAICLKDLGIAILLFTCL